MKITVEHGAAFRLHTNTSPSTVITTKITVERGDAFRLHTNAPHSTVITHEDHRGAWRRVSPAHQHLALHRDHHEDHRGARGRVSHAHQPPALHRDHARRSPWSV